MQYLNMVNVMAYDMGNAPKHHSALYRSKIVGWLCASDAVEAHRKAGVPDEKIVLGMPFYGRGKSGVYMKYRDRDKHSETEVWSNTSKAPFLKDENGELAIGFESPRSIAAKCAYIKQQGLRGAMYWEYADDNEQGDLQRAVWQGVLQSDKQRSASCKTAAQRLAAVLKENQKREDITPDSFFYDWRQLKAEMLAEKDPTAQAIYRAAMAHMLCQNRWRSQGYGRKTSSHPDSIQEWSIQEYNDYAIKLYAQAMQDPDALHRCKVANIKPLAVPGKDDAIFDGDLLYLIWQTFKDDCSARGKGLFPHYTDIIDVYRRHGRREAALLLRIDSLEEAPVQTSPRVGKLSDANPLSSGEKSREELLLRLRDEYIDLPACADVFMLLAKLPGKSNQERQDLLEEALRRYPKSRQANELKNRIAELRQPSLRTRFNEMCYPDKDYDIPLEIKNMQSGSIAVYRLPIGFKFSDEEKAGTKLANQSSAPDIADGAFFSDGIRDAVKGSVFGTQAGYVTGNASSTSAVINALYSLPGWENYDKPQQSVVNYNSCHDNYTLYDRLQITDGNTTADDETLLKQNSLAASIVMLAQGIPFFQAGEEILRTKVKSDGSFDENSYASPASENSIKWDTLNEDNYKTSYEYYKGLIAFRKLHPSFRGVGEEFQYPDTGAIIKNDGTVITYELPLGMNGDSSRIFVVYNPTDETYTAELPDSGTWNVYAKDDKAGTEVLGTVEDTMDVSPLTCMIVAQDPEIIVETTDYELNVGETVAINAKASPESALDDGISYEFDNKVVDVDPDGNITAVGSGDATIIIRLASNPNITKEVNVHVKDAAETVADTDKTVYTLGSAMSAVGWQPQNMANAFTDSDVNGVVKATINVPAEGANEWEYRFGIIATTDNTTQAWNRALVGTTVAPETTDTTSCCLTNIRPALEAEAYEAVVYYDTKTGAVAIYKADDTKRTTPLEYTLSWVGNDNDETYYAPDEYTQFATVGDYEATLNAKADRTADLEKCGYTADSKLPDFVTLKEDLETKLGGIADLSVSYKVQVQKTGWEKSYVSDGTTSGTVGQALRLEAIKIKLTNSDGTDFDTTNGGIEYRVHVQKNGWEKEYLANDELSGTVGEAKRLEAIQIRLTGKVADYYDVYYRVQAEKFGWLGWAKNDEEAGTSGYGYRLEGIQVVLVEKDGEAPTEAGGVAASSRNEYYSKTALPVVQYRVQVQTYGWQSYVKNGQTSGTVGKAKRLEAIRIKIADNKGVSGSIQYRTHVQKKGWQKWVSDDALSGTVGKALRLEAIQIKLTGDLAEKYDIYYRVQAEKFGWMGWAKNGASAGTSGYGYRLEAIQIQLAYKNSPSAVIGSTSNAYRSK